MGPFVQPEISPDTRSDHAVKCLTDSDWALGFELLGRILRCEEGTRDFWCLCGKDKKQVWARATGGFRTSSTHERRSMASLWTQLPTKYRAFQWREFEEFFSKFIDFQFCIRAVLQVVKPRLALVKLRRRLSL